MMRELQWLAPLIALGCTPGQGAVGKVDPGLDSGVSTATGLPGGTPVGTSGGTPTTTGFVLEVSTLRVGDSLGLRTNLPAFEADCLPAAPCGDADQDGLVDAWEDVVLDRLRPAIRFDEAEPLINDADAVLADVGRVAPSDDGLGIRVYIMIGYSEDYGRCGISAHPGDSERVVVDLELVGAGDADALGFYTAAHENTITDSGHVFQGAELAELSFETDPGTGEPRWMIYASDGKHASYGSVQRCEDSQWAPCVEEDCEADGVPSVLPYTRLPPIWNAGEEAAPFLTELTSVGFPGEEAWVEQDFCGGLNSGLFGCAASVREKLVNDPF